MEENKKISELDAIQNISNTDEFIVIDKDVTSGNDASSSGKTSKVTLAQLKNALHTEGQKENVGEDGIKGKQGDDGEQGESGEQGAVVKLEIKVKLVPKELVVARSNWRTR